MNSVDLFVTHSPGWTIPLLCAVIGGAISSLITYAVVSRLYMHAIDQLFQAAIRERRFTHGKRAYRVTLMETRP